MVDPGEELDLSKENIQPLKKGRVVSQLGTALLAQDDLEAHHELLKEREKYEILLRTYEGSDPLEPWYEYILWVEQSFLRDGREGNLYILLQRCLTQFKEDERYLQDRRYIELWIKYIEMSINPLEIYKKCHSHGIGKYCAFFYITWAFEFEKAGDIKRANQVFSEGFRNNSQPRDELEDAHKNFQLRVARQVLSGESEIETVCTEQRVVLSRLKALGRKKNLVGSVRVGDNVQCRSAGILQPITQHGHHSSNVQTGSIEVFNDEECNISTEFAILERGYMSSVPRREILDKENMLDPGPWTSKPHKGHTAAVPVSRPQQPPFKLHQDEEEQVLASPLVICNALKPRKLDDEEFKCAIAVFEPEDPSKHPVYCKHKVYAGGTEFSFEELRAIEYLKCNRPTRCKQVGKLYNEACDQKDGLSCPIAVFEPPDPTKRPMYCKGKVYANGTEFSFEELRAVEYLKHNRPIQCKQACAEEHEADSEPTVAKLYGEELHKIKMFEALDIKTQKTNLQVVQATEKQHLNSYMGSNILAASLCVGDESEEEAGAGAVIPMMDAENAGVACPKLLVGKQSNWIKNYCENDGTTAASSNVLPKPSHMKPSPLTDSSTDSAKLSSESCDQSLCHQSLTYHTKEAMNIMHELWTTPEDKKLQYNMHHMGGSESKKKIFQFGNVDAQCLHPEQPNIKVGPFEIFRDESEVQEQVKNDNCYESHPERKADHFEIFRDETEVMGHMQNGSSNLLDPAQHRSEIGMIFRDTIQSLHNERRGNQISEPHGITNENCPLSYLRDEDIAPDSGTDQPLSLHVRTSNGEDALNPQIFSCSNIKVIVDAPVSPDGSIPLVPSPGMTEDEERALKGTEAKENILPEGVLPSQAEERNMAGILQPSRYFPCNPQDDPALQAQELLEPETYYNNVTCNTQAFSNPLWSSTPFVGQVKESHGWNTAESSEKTGYCESDEVCAHRSAGSAAHRVENLSIIMETTEYCKSSSSSSSSGATTRHTAFSQENCTTGSMKRNENIRKSSRNSEQDRVITETWQENPIVQEVHRQCEQCSIDNSVVKRTSESFCYKMETMHHRNKNSNYPMGQVQLPEQPDPSLNVYRKESVKLMLQEEPDLYVEQEGIQGCQQITLRHSGSLKNTGLQDEESLLKSQEGNLFHAKTDDPHHVRRIKIYSGPYKDKSSRAQENCLTGGIFKFQIEKHKDIDPFDHSLIQQLLTHLQFPEAENNECYVKVNMHVPRFKTGGTVTLGKDKFAIEKVLGEGSYAKVFKATDMKTQKTVALKVQKPSWEWEFYICRQIQSRLSDPLSAMSFMDVHMAYMLNNGSVMVTEYSHYGSLLSVIAKLRQQWTIPEGLMLYWMLELLSIAEKLQECCIIHGDIKPDNFILRTLPSFGSKEPSLQLIDMGRGIDMTLFPEGTTFNTVVTTKDFQCIEMQTKQPWTYQTDLYGIAGTMHCVYFNQYMKVYKQRDGRWSIQQSISRYSKRQLWEQFFSTLLNVESCEKLPDLSQLRSMVEAEILNNNHFSFMAPVRKILADKSKK